MGNILFYLFTFFFFFFDYASANTNETAKKNNKKKRKQKKIVSKNNIITFFSFNQYAHFLYVLFFLLFRRGSRGTVAIGVNLCRKRPFESLYHGVRDGAQPSESETDETISL